KIVSNRARSSGFASQATISPASAASISRVSATNSASRSSIIHPPPAERVVSPNVVKSGLSRPLHRSAAGELGLLLGDELDQCGLAAVNGSDGAPQGGDNLRCFGHALAVTSQRAGERGVIAGNVSRAILLGGDRHDRQF